ncbi:hypothetical protein AB21_5377 [Escherichia coli 4-203-08_S1_C1]|nr:hypothetical protein AB21_5377 [Escherichia coli 4-203-08_S1_C1]
MIQGQAVEAACQPARTPLAGWRLPEGKRATLARRPLPFPSVMCLTQECFFLMLWKSVICLLLMMLLFPAALILTTAVLSCLPGAPSAPGCLAASGRQARLRQAAAGAPASLRRTRWRGFGLSLRSDA